MIPATTIAADATAAVINLTTTDSTRGGYMAAFPCGQPAPPSSNLNWIAGEDRAVGAIVGLGLGRTLCLISEVPTNVIVDVTGYYAPAPPFSPSASLQPDSGRRVVDTRNGIGGPRAAFAAGEIRSFDPVAGLANADDASAVMLNFISTNSSASGYLTVFPCGGAVPYVSSLNFTARQDATNLATVKIGDGRKVCVLASAPTDVIVDVFGVMNAPAGSPFERLTFDKPTWPDFDPAATDYVIECGAGAGVSNVTIGLGLMPSTAVSVAVAGGAPIPVGNGSVTVPMRTDDSFVVATTRNGVQRDYHFRCVPLDFPRLTVSRPGNPTPGWYLTTFGFAGSPLTGEFLVDPRPLRRPGLVQADDRAGHRLQASVGRPLASTPLLGQAFGTDPLGVLEHRIDGTFLGQIFTATPAALPTDHHDFVEIPGGHAMLSYPLLSRGSDALNSTLAVSAARCSRNVSVLVERPHRRRRHPGDCRRRCDRGSGERAITSRRLSTFPIDSTCPSTAPPVWSTFYHLNVLQYRSTTASGDYVVTARHLDSASGSTTPRRPSTGPSAADRLPAGQSPHHRR